MGGYDLDSSCYLEVANLRKSFGSNQALDGVSFSVQPGEMFGLLGPNGAGKTTLMSILSGLLEGDAGTVRIQGQLFLRQQQHLRPKIGIVPQDLAIYLDLTARENLRFFGQLYGVVGADLDERVRQILDAIGLSDRADHRVATFSGGMKRRLNLGAALVHRPELLLLDEPTTGVDPQSRNHIFEGVRRLNAQGMTVLYTSHYMEEVQALCARIGIMDQGRLIACDTLTSLLRVQPSRIRLRFVDADERVHRLFHEFSAEAKSNGWFEIETTEPTKALLQITEVLHRERVQPAEIETEQPNLERVFLHLTGRALRD